MSKLKAIIRADGVVFNLDDLRRCSEQKFRGALFEILYQAGVVDGVDESSKRVRFNQESSPAPDSQAPDTEGAAALTAEQRKRANPDMQTGAKPEEN